MNDCEQLFFQFIQLAVGQRKGLTHRPSEDEWEMLFELAKRHGVAGVLYGAAEAVAGQFNISPLPRRIVKWYDSCMKINTMNESLMDVCRKVDDFFHRNGLEGTILKGLGIALLYDKPECRLCSDVDYWIYRCVDGDAHQSATGVDIIIGRVLQLANKLSHRDHHVCFHHCDFGRMNNVAVEVHWRPSWMYNPITNRRFQRWARKQTVDFRTASELNCTLPSQSFNRVFILLHIYRHLFFEGIGLRQVMDYYYVLRQGYDEQERQKTLRVIRDLHLTLFTRALMWVLREVFGAPCDMLLCAPCEKDGRFLLHEIMTGGDMGKSDTGLHQKRNESDWHFSARKVKRNFHLLRFGFMEVICTPFWRLWHCWWRTRHRAV